MSKFKAILDKGKEYVLIILLSLAVFLIGIYYFFKISSPAYFKNNIDGFKELFGIGLAVLSSGIFLAVLKWLQFMRFFREEMHNIIESSQFDEKMQKLVFDVLYSDKFLENLHEKSLSPLWSRINRALFKNQFSDELARRVEEKMQDTFLHNSKLSHHYQNFIFRPYITIDDEEFLTIQLITEARIIRPNKEKFKYDFTYYSLKLNAADKKSAVNINTVLIDGALQAPSKIFTTQDDDIKIARKFETELEDRTAYELYIELTLIYNIAKDRELSMLSERFIDNVRVEVELGAGLDFFFLPIGNEPFEALPASNGKIIKTYKQLLFPEKGFRIIFTKK